MIFGSGGFFVAMRLSLTAPDVARRARTCQLGGQCVGAIGAAFGEDKKEWALP